LRVLRVMNMVVSPLPWRERVRERGTRIPTESEKWERKIKFKSVETLTAKDAKDAKGREGNPPPVKRRRL